MRRIAIAAAVMFATASLVSASPLTPNAPELNATPVQLAQTMQQKQTPQPEQKNQQDQKAKQNQKTMPQNNAAQKKNETITQKVKRTWRNWTTPSHSFCVRCPIPVPLTAKTCTAKGKTVDEARNSCIQQNPLCYVQAGKC